MRSLVPSRKRKAESEKREAENAKPIDFILEEEKWKRLTNALSNLPFK